MTGWPIKWGAWLPWFRFFWSWWRHLSTREGWDLGRTPCIVIGFLLTLCGKSHIFPFWLQNILKPSRPVYKISFQLSKIDSLYLKSGSLIFPLWTLASETNNQGWVPCIRWPLLPSSGGSSYQTRWAQGKNSTKNWLKIFSTQEKTPQKFIYVKSRFDST